MANKTLFSMRLRILVIERGHLYFEGDFLVHVTERVGIGIGHIQLKNEAEEALYDLVPSRNKDVAEPKDNELGFNGGIGLEYNVARNLALFIAGNRYISLD